MSRDFGKIETGFWSNPAVQDLSAEAERMLLYLFSSPHGNSVGCFTLKLGYLVADLRRDEQTVRDTLSELYQKPFIRRCERTGLTMICGWWGHNSIESPKVAVSAIRLIDKLPDCDIKVEFIQQLLHHRFKVDSVNEAFRIHYGGHNAIGYGRPVRIPETRDERLETQTETIEVIESSPEAAESARDPSSPPTRSSRSRRSNQTVEPSPSVAPSANPRAAPAAPRVAETVNVTADAGPPSPPATTTPAEPVAAQGSVPELQVPTAGPIPPDEPRPVTPRAGAVASGHTAPTDPAPPPGPTQQRAPQPGPAERKPGAAGPAGPVAVPDTPERLLSRRFLDLRDRQWPSSPDLPAPLVSLDQQAEHWLRRGLTADAVMSVVAKGMLRMHNQGGRPPQHFNVFNRSLEDAAMKAPPVTRRHNHDRNTPEGEEAYQAELEAVTVKAFVRELGATTDAEVATLESDIMADLARHDGREARRKALEDRIYGALGATPDPSQAAF